MSTSSFVGGSGYTCAVCGDYVLYNTGHLCRGYYSAEILDELRAIRKLLETRGGV
jgi:hypothetical protein